MPVHQERWMLFCDTKALS